MTLKVIAVNPWVRLVCVLSIEFCETLILIVMSINCVADTHSVQYSLET